MTGKVEWEGHSVSMFTSLRIFDTRKLSTLIDLPPEESGDGGQGWKRSTHQHSVSFNANRSCGISGYGLAQTKVHVAVDIPININAGVGSTTVMASHSYSKPDAAHDQQALRNCTDEDLDPVGGSTTIGGGGEGGTSWWICYYYDVYDLITGAYLGREDAGCDPLFEQ